ncbi:hypothetical protein [Halomonas korlensis]|uniref:Uncharacterized protein n=1 Tax=Halomonas korlensis TaxID=463301 RepID=A0A1I7HCX2_9GAMM|nr:hypothetical protein [Halomonas korlensis]SFU58594.1 hypothetical protein SAMN04487955_104166 [Halomonas korlensis]
MQYRHGVREGVRLKSRDFFESLNNRFWAVQAVEISRFFTLMALQVADLSMVFQGVGRADYCARGEVLAMLVGLLSGSGMSFITSLKKD